MTIDFYYDDLSAPCRAIMLLGNILGIEFNLKEINLMARDNTKPEYKKINNQQVVPTIVDDGFTLKESRAILIYLVEKYAKDDTLYPKDLYERAIVNQQLYFDMGTLYQSFIYYYYPVLFSKAPSLSPIMLKRLENAVGYLNTDLQNNKFAAGDSLTIADLALVASIATYDAFKFDLSKYPNVVHWYEMCKNTIPGYEANEVGANNFMKKCGHVLEKLESK